MVVNSAGSSLTATAPSGTGTVDVTVSTPNGTSATGTADQFTYAFSSNGYAATITAGTTAAASGQTVTLTATANQDVWPTPYGLTIVDITTGTVVAHTGGSSSTSGNTVLVAPVSQPTASSQQYVARIDAHGTINVQAISTPVTVVWGAGGASISRAASFPVTGEASGLYSTVIDPQHVGDLIIMAVQEHNTSMTVTSVTGGGATNWTRATHFIDTSNTLTYEVWYATAISTGTSSLYVLYKGTSALLPIEMTVDSFVPPPGSAKWIALATGGSSNPRSSSVRWPTLVSGPARYQMYWGISEEISSGFPGNSPGFVYNETDNQNTFIYNPSLSPTTAYGPVSVESPAAVSTSVAVLFVAA